MIINKGTFSSLFTGFNTLFQQGFEAAMSDWDKVAMTVPSNTKSETYGWMGKVTQFREWVGDRVLQNLSAGSYQIFNKDFENTVVVDRNDIEDDTLGIYAPIMRLLGEDARVHRDKLVFSLMKAGFTTNCYDGQYFFDTDHPVGTGTVSNYGGGAGTAWYLLDLSRSLRPFIVQMRKDYKFQSLQSDTDENVFMRKQFVYGVDARLNVGYGLWQQAYASKQTLDATNFASAKAAMASFTADNGDVLNIRPTLLVVPPSLESAARTLLNAEITSNTTNIWRGSVDLLVTPWVI
jgi:phage major head subunit gpT-like protein